MTTTISEQLDEDFEAFYTRTHALYWSVVQHILRQHEESDDTLQEAYFKLWRKWNDAPTKRKERDAWAYTTVRNCALDRWRRLHTTNPQGPRTGSVSPLRHVSLEKMGHDFLSEHERDPEEIIVEQEREQEQHARLRSVIEQLPDSYRVLLRLYCSDLPYKIVNRSGEQSARMKTRKRRAIRAAQQLARKTA